MIACARKSGLAVLLVSILCLLPPVPSAPASFDNDFDNVPVNDDFGGDVREVDGAGAGPGGPVTVGPQGDFGDHLGAVFAPIFGKDPRDFHENKFRPPDEEERQRIMEQNREMERRLRKWDEEDREIRERVRNEMEDEARQHAARQQAERERLGVPGDSAIVREERETKDGKNQVATTAYIADGSYVHELMTEGLGGTRDFHDANGQWVTRHYMNEDGTPSLIVNFQHDANGNFTGTKEYNPDGSFRRSVPAN